MEYPVRHDWKMEELESLYALPLLELISRANAVHVKYHLPSEVQLCSLISIKTGGCPEDCKYCPQSSHYNTFVKAQPLMTVKNVISDAQKAIDRGATRICLGAAWKEVRDNVHFENILKMVRGITDLGAEVCCTLGMLKPEYAERLKEAGLYAYNHNLDSSESFYKTIITTRTYQDRLDTLDIVQKTGLSTCCGGIIGMGESVQDRLELLQTLSQRQPHPDSVPINRLIRVPGTPYESVPEISIWETARMIAMARIMMPKSMVRFSAGRASISFEGQAICFLAGANSIFLGEKLFTCANPSVDSDEEMMKILGVTRRPPFAKETSHACS